MEREQRCGERERVSAKALCTIHSFILVPIMCAMILMRTLEHQRGSCFFFSLLFTTRCMHMLTRIDEAQASIGEEKRSCRRWFASAAALTHFVTVFACSFFPRFCSSLFLRMLILFCVCFFFANDLLILHIWRNNFRFFFLLLLKHVPLIICILVTMTSNDSWVFASLSCTYPDSRDGHWL